MTEPGATRGPHILLVEAPYYRHIAAELAEGALSALEAAGATFERLEVPGAFEIPAAIRLAADTGRFDGFVALGCVIRGETTHYDYVCGESARGLQTLALEHRLAIGFGVLTVENEAQALARARVTEKNKGGEAVQACLAMIALKQHLAGIV
jgi:6,7-dimethyl-8-ribityllumazine synthase